MSRHSGGGGRVGGLRQWVNDNSAVVTVATVAILILAVLFIFKDKFGGGPDIPDIADQKSYYYDTVTLKNFVDGRDKTPPFLNEAGNECVRVRMYTCGSCAEGEMWPAFYEKYTEEFKQQLEEIRAKTDGNYMPMMGGMMGPGQTGGMLLSTDGQNWVTQMDPSIRDKYKEMMTKCPDGKYRPCNPGDKDKKK